jgi:hypothetical protein
MNKNIKIKELPPIKINTQKKIWSDKMNGGLVLNPEGLTLNIEGEPLKELKLNK